jgi:membrane protein
MSRQKQSVLVGWWAKARQFIIDELPVEDVSKRPVVKKLRTAAQFVYLVVQGFVGNRCPLRAAALCYTTLLALVPLLAVVFSISQSFLRESSADVVPKLLDEIVAKVAPQLEYIPADGKTGVPAAKGHVVVSSEARRQVVENIQAFISNVNAGAVTTIGSLFLAFVAIRLLMTIEQTFNDIWGVQKGRSIWRKVVYYWTSITLGSVVLVSATAVTGTAEFSQALGKFAVVPGFQRFLIQLAPYMILWAGFAFMYGLMPNTTVRPGAALVGGIVGGTLWQLNSLLSTMYLSRVVTYSKIYGALGILPVFLIGLYFSWLIVLFGAQVSFAVQNVKTYMQQRASEKIDQRGRELLACRMVLHVCHAFLRGQEPPSTQEIADQIRAPVQLLNQLVGRLTDGGVLRVVADRDGGLAPARPPESITVADVLHVVRTNSGTCGEQVSARSGELIEKLLSDLQATTRAANANARFSDLAAKLDSASF